MVRFGSGLCLSFALASCVGYRADDSDAASIAAELHGRAGGTFSWSEAVVTALRQNPELRALEAELRAAEAVTQPFDVEAEYRGDTEMLAVLLDPVALLGLGSRGSAAGVDDRVAEAAAQRLAVARWRTVAAVAEAFALETSLAAIPAPSIEVDPDTFGSAGLASPVATLQLRAAVARLGAEASMVTAERAANRARLRELLGLPAGAEFTFAGDTPPIDQPPAEPGAVLTRPDLALATAEFRVADAEFRREVAAQYPSLRLGPDIPLRGGMLETMAVLRLPFAMAGPAAAARERRDAARERLAAAWLRADNEAAAAEHALASARAADDAATAGLQTSLQALATGKIAVEVDVDESAFDRLAEAAAMVAQDAMERRTAAIGRVRAEVARAVAFGWPANRRSS